jgi:hypothetical protein
MTEKLLEPAESGRSVLFGVFDGYRGINGKWKWYDRETLLTGGVAPPQRIME